MPKYNSNVRCCYISYVIFCIFFVYFVCWYVAFIFRLSCLPVFAWRRVVLHIFAPKQLLRVSCILFCYSKCYSIILEKASLWCFIVIIQIAFDVSAGKFQGFLMAGITFFYTHIMLHPTLVNLSEILMWLMNIFNLWFTFSMCIILPLLDKYTQMSGQK